MLESSSGIMPATKATVVIRMGRSRSRLACQDGFVARHARGAELVGVVDLQDRVLLHHAEEHQDAQQREDVERLLEDDQRDQARRAASAAARAGW